MPMRFHRLDLNLLIALDALIEERNTTRAAERLSVSQSAISGMLARLRDYFEDPLLAPVGRQLEPTPLARELAGPLRDVLLQLQATLEIRPGFDPRTAQRHLRITASDYVMRIFLGRLLGDLKRQGPKLSFEVLPQTDDAPERLRRGDTEFLIIPEPFLAEGHPYRLLYEDEFVTIAWRGSQVAASGVLDAETFCRLGHAAPMLGRPRDLTLDGQHLERQGLRRRVEIVAPDFSSLPLLIEGSELLGNLHRRLAEQEAERHQLRLFPPPVPLPLVRECVQWHTHHEHDPCHRWVREQMLAWCATLPPLQATASAHSPPGAAPPSTPRAA